MPDDPWFGSLAPCESHVPCGPGRHVVRWEAGELGLPSHADPEAELVLAALGGDKARCVEVAEAWARHTADLTVLGIGPRGPADEILVSWEDVDAAAQAGAGIVFAPHGPRRLASPPVAAIARVSAARQQSQRELGELSQRRNDMLSLLALGYGFQVRLIGHVVAAHAGRLDRDGEGPGIRPVLTAALAGRLAPVAEQWLGIDPDQVVVSLHPGSGGAEEVWEERSPPRRGVTQGGSRGMGPPGRRRSSPGGQQSEGWGSTEMTGRGEQRRLHVSLPASWLARVWAPGLALAGGHLVVAVRRAGWPDAQVLALRAPGAEPVPLDVHASHDPSAAPDVPHWEV